MYFFAYDVKNPPVEFVSAKLFALTYWRYRKVSEDVLNERVSSFINKLKSTYRTIVANAPRRRAPIKALWDFALSVFDTVSAPCGTAE